jgi:hypothetical protein
MKFLSFKTALFLSAMVGASNASAAIVDFTLDFTASNFTVGAPIDPVSGSIRFAFDNSANVDATTAGLTINSFSLPISSYLPNFSYWSSGDVISFGTNVVPGGCGGGGSVNNFCTMIVTASSNPSMGYFSYSVEGVPGVYDSFAVTVRVVPTVTPSVPEPATWAMMIGGLALIGTTMRRRKMVIGFA